MGNPNKHLSSRTPLTDTAIMEGVLHLTRNVPVCVAVAMRTLSFSQIERSMCDKFRDPKFGTPRCTRERAWDVGTRLAELDNPSN